MRHLLRTLLRRVLLHDPLGVHPKKRPFAQILQGLETTPPLSICRRCAPEEGKKGVVVYGAQIIENAGSLGQRQGIPL